MYKSGRVLAFIAVFLLLVSFPFLAAFGNAGSDPVYDLSVQTSDATKVKCVESTDYMKSSHMKLLQQWRDDVVRNGQNDFISSNGQAIPMSLDDTCLNCHTDKEAFCDSCHSYSGVTMDCWDCHGTNSPDAKK